MWQAKGGRKEEKGVLENPLRTLRNESELLACRAKYQALFCSERNVEVSVPAVV